MASQGHIAAFHRLGLVPVTEASVIIPAVSSAHRAASLEAVSYATDALKAWVPLEKENVWRIIIILEKKQECFWAASA